MPSQTPTCLTHRMSTPFHTQMRPTVYRSIARRHAASSQPSDTSAIFASHLAKTLSAMKRRCKA